LVLNVTDEPLGVISMERAVTLVVLGDASIALDTGGVIRSATLTIPEPSVIKLRKNIKLDRSKSVPLSRRALFARDNHECAYCEEGVAETVDHVDPKAHGGKHEWTNVVSACGPCNWRKRDRTPEEAGMPLRFRPFAPDRAFMLGARNRPEWEPFLYRQETGQSAYKQVRSIK
jgi:5-methylcytosine-specific restriction endonuclease McrA